MLVITLIIDKDDGEFVEALYTSLKNDMLYVANKILHNIDSLVMYLPLLILILKVN